MAILKEDRSESTLNQLVQMTGKSQRTIKKRLAGIATIRDHGNAYIYSTKQALAAIYLSDEDNNVIDLNVERALLARSQRAKIELDIATLEKLRLPTEFVVLQCAQLANIVKSKVRAIPNQAKTKIPKLTKTDVGKLETLCNRALLDISDHGMPPQLRATLDKHHGRIPAAAKTDPEPMG